MGDRDNLKEAPGSHLDLDLVPFLRDDGGRGSGSGGVAGDDRGGVKVRRGISERRVGRFKRGAGRAERRRAEGAAGGGRAARRRPGAGADTRPLLSST